jgi:hypothetical protein
MILLELTILNGLIGMFDLSGFKVNSSIPEGNALIAGI